MYRWWKEGNFWEVQRKRGRKQLFEKAPAEARGEWDRQLDALRSQGEFVTGRVSAVVARAVLSEQAATLLQNGGRFSVGQRTGRRMLSRSDRSFRKGTSNKILPAVEDLETAKDQFYWARQDTVEDNEGASTHRALAPCTPRALARCQESDYCTTFSSNNAVVMITL